MKSGLRQSLIQTCLLAAALALPAVVQAQFAYTTTNSAITITGYGGSGGAVIIPDTINGLPVRSIGYGALGDREDITSVTIPNSVTNIEDSSFIETGLTNVAIGDSVVRIGSDAFAYCRSLTTITIGTSVTSIGEDTFTECASLTSINVVGGNSAYSSVAGVLLDKSHTTLVQYPNGKVGSYIIPNSITNIGEKGFQYCGSLSSITILDSLVSIGDLAFDQCGLTNATIGNGVVSIGGSAFAECQGLASVTIGNKVTSIGDRAFLQCFSLTNVRIPSNVTNIGDYAFFQTGLTNVTIGNGVISIGNSAFSATSLTSVTIPDSVTSIGDWAFEGCYGLTNVTFGSSVISIGDDAFNFCTGLTSVTIPRNVSTIGEEAFVYCSSLTAINVDVANLFLSSAAGVLFNKNQTTLVEYPAGKTGNNYIIPTSVTDIGDYAFENCVGPTNITIGNSVTNIGKYAFNQSDLTSVTISDSVTSIGDGAFSGSFGLTSIVLPGSVTSIGDLAFSGCPYLTSATIPNGIASIGEGAFAGCFSLTNVTIGSSVTNIGEGAFAACDDLTSVHFTGNAPGVSSNAFSWLLAEEGVYVIDPATVYYLPNTAGWSSTFAGLPTALWLPQVQIGDGSFGVRTNQFGFNIAWASGQTVVVEACTDLANPLWQPVQTNMLTSDSVYFGDSQWTNYSARFYRLKQQ
jgi:hypothetical protein